MFQVWRVRDDTLRSIRSRQPRQHGITDDTLPCSLGAWVRDNDPIGVYQARLAALQSVERFELVRPWLLSEEKDTDQRTREGLPVQ